jgi:uncharacterized protein YhfF
MDEKQALVEAFWQRYLTTLPAEARQPLLASSWSFGDSPRLADELLALVLAGVKTATCGALWEFEAAGEPLPKEGDLSVVLDGAGQPRCIVETMEVVLQPYSEVGPDFAAAEGEGDRSLEYWRAAHKRYFSRTLPAIGREFSEDMPLVCERFRMRFPLA